MNYLPIVSQYVSDKMPMKSEFQKLKDYFNKYHDYNFSSFDDNPTHTSTINATYTVIDPVDIKDKLIDYLGAVLAQCWITPGLLYDLNDKPHETLLEMGIILPRTMDLKVRKEKGKDRPRLVLFEIDPITRKQKRICYLQLNMTAGR